MHRTTIMLPDDLWERVRVQAGQREVSASEWIREAIVAVLYYELARSGDREIAAALTLARRMKTLTP